jgi:hypothetical protein
MFGRENKKLAETINAYASVFATEAGNMVLKDLESFCGQNRSSVCEEVPNAIQTMFAEGKRRVYLRIVSFMEQEKLKREQEIVKQARKDSKNGS